MILTGAGAMLIKNFKENPDFLKLLGKRKENFFCRRADYVARNILGDFLVVKNKKNILAGRIVETEAYLGKDDDAAHSFLAKKTKRNQVLYEKGGLVYVYLIYGLYWCFNIVVSQKSDPQSVLIRAIEPWLGAGYMGKKRKGNLKNLTNGPCRWTQAFGINRKFLAEKISGNKIFILKKKKKDFSVIETSRIGIDYALKSRDLPLRYYIKGNSWVSKM